MREHELAGRFAAAKSIAREVGAMALERFRNRDGLAVERKGVQDRVTAVDRAVEAAIRARLGALFPDDEDGLVAAFLQAFQAGAPRGRV